MDGLKKSPVPQATRPATDVPPARLIPAAPFGAESGVVGAGPADAPIHNREPAQSSPGAEHTPERGDTDRMAKMTASRGPSAQRGAFVPLLLGGLALLLWFVLQAWLLLDEEANLRAAHASQQQTVERAGKLRQSLDAIAADTQRLADAGNPNARLLVEELRKRGVTINPNPAPAAAPTPAQK